MRKQLRRVIALAVLFALTSGTSTTSATLPSPGDPSRPAETSSDGLIIMEDVAQVRTLPHTATAHAALAVAANMSEDFEAAWPAPGWEVVDQSDSDGGEYLWGKRDCHPRTGGFAGWSVGGGAQGSALACGANYPNNANYWAVYGPFNLRDAVSASLTFHIWGRTPLAEDDWDYLYVGSSIDGTHFVGVGYSGDVTGGNEGNGYHRQTLDLSDRLGESEVWVAFAFISDSSGTEIGFNIDDVSLTSSGLPPSFSLGWSSTELDDSISVAWGDYDGDGDLDLAVGNDGPNRLYRNDGGALIPSVVWSSTEADSTHSVAWGDYDNDGDLDLAVGNDGPNRLYRNDGRMLTASAVWESAEADNTRSVAWGDHDGDGDLDLAVGNGVSSWPDGEPNRLYRNDGLEAGDTPNFTLAWSSTETDATASVAWGDYDGDGDLDLAAGNYGFGQPNRLYRNGGETLTTSAVWASTETDYTYSVAWGDYDGDGDLDLAAGNGSTQGGPFTGQPNRLYRNDGLGAGDTPNFTAAWSSTEADWTNSVAWGDYDGDGDPDLAVGNDDSTRLYRNDGGTLTASVVWSSPETNYTEDVAWGDYDGDGDLDLAVGNHQQPNRLYRNDGGALTTRAVWVSTEADDTLSVAWGDSDSDGDLDLVTGNRGPNRLYRNDAGTFTTSAAWISTPDDWANSVAWGDYDGDGDLDLAVGNGGHLEGDVNALYRNDGGTLNPSPVWSSIEVEWTNSVTWGDYDGDGDLDLAVGNDGDPNRVYRNDNGVLTTSAVWTSSETDYTSSVAWGDYDGDGDLDLAVGNGSWKGAQPNRLYRNDGRTLTESAVWSSNETDDTRSVAWGDYDGDGDLDLATGNRGPNRLYRSDGGELSVSAVWASNEADATNGVVWGDYDGDGDLDLAVGNYWNQPNRLYRNDGDVLTTNAIWSSGEAEHTSSVAWGDYDGDGDLDLVAGNEEDQLQIGSMPNRRLYRNLRRGIAPLVNNPPYVTISRPSATDDANFFSTPHIIQAANIPITYTLFDPEGDIVPKIFLEFSPNGGGWWFPATPGPGGDGMNNLTASPEGTSHTSVWNAEADLIKGDNVVFRIRAQPGYSHSPILWPALDGKSPPFRVAVPWYIKVVDENGDSVPGATVYADGQPITQTVTGLTVTNRAGLLNPGPLEVGTTLVALAQQAEQPTNRDAHDGWAYRTYLTTQPFTVSEPGEQRLVISRTHPLVLFNLVVSVEWDATDAYLDEIARAVRYASDYVYDLTDGQMAFGRVNIYDNAEHWADADLQISTKNIVRPHAYVGGITSDDKSHVIRVGRGWDGCSGNQGPWDQPDGYRTLAHEFGHYALHLYDEYFAYLFDQDGNLLGEVPSYCTGPENRNPATDATNASAMDYQYTTSELSAHGVSGLWSDLCEGTAQWQLNGESAWETLVRVYTDTVSPPRWQFTTPLDREDVLAGPDGLRPDLPERPLVETHQVGPSAPPRQLTVYGPQGPYWGAIVALYRQDGRVIGQGFADRNGRLEVYGADEGDTLRAASMDGGLAGSATVGAETSLTLTLTPVGGLATQAAGRGIPHMRVIAEPSQDPSQIDLLVSLQNLGSGADPEVTITEPSTGVSYSPPTWNYSPTRDTYEGQVSFSASKQGMWRIRAVGAVGNSLVRLQSTYRLQRALNDQSHDVYSDDGNLSLHLEPGSLPGEEAYFVVMPPGALPGPLPTGLTLVGDPYDVTASGALVALEQPAVLKLRYDGALVNSSSAPEGLGIYRWDPANEAWQAVAGELDDGQRALVAPVTALGTYALLAPPGLWMRNSVFLPLILKGAP